MAASAFSLPELMIALVILGLGLLIIAAALPAGLQYTSDTSAQSTGEAVANYAIEVLTQKATTSRKLADTRRRRDPLYTGPDADDPIPGWRTDMFVRPRIKTALPGSPLDERNRALDPMARHLAARLDAPNPTTNPDPAAPFDLATIPVDPNNPTAIVGADWEPIIKLRALIGMNIDPTMLTAVPTTGPNSGAAYGQIVEDTEEQIRNWLAVMENTTLGAARYLRQDVSNLLTDVDVDDVNRWPGSGSGPRIGLSTTPALSSTMRAFPPAENAPRYRVSDYFRDLAQTAVVAQPLPFGGDTRYGPAYLHATPSEVRRIATTRYAWTAFYRRLSYAPGSDPLLYEIIVVVTRRPSESHYYLATDTAQANFSAPALNALALAVSAGPRPRVLPQPWLVTFVRGPDGNFFSPPPPFAPNGNVPFDSRSLQPGAQLPDRLTFYATPNVAKILPKGSYFFPAVNDESRRGSSSSTIVGNSPDDHEIAGFSPRAPGELPLYQVVDVVENVDRRTDLYGIVVAFNGFYPWARTPNWPTDWRTASPDPISWPVWVIPPTVSGGVLERKSPIVSIMRKTMRLPEIKN